MELASHIDTAKGNLVVDDLTIWFNELLFIEHSHIEIHSGLSQPQCFELVSHSA